MRTFIRLLTGLILFAGLAACTASSPASTFYTLNPTIPEQGLAVAPQLTIAVGPVELADYLDRPEIVTRASATTLKFAGFDRWGGSLQENVARILVLDLERLLGLHGYRVVSWDSRINADRRLAVTVNRFEAEAEKIYLDAAWVFTDDRRQILAGGTSRISEAPDGAGYPGIVSGMSRALAAMSREIAGKIPAP